MERRGFNAAGGWELRFRVRWRIGAVARLKKEEDGVGGRGMFIDGVDKVFPMVYDTRHCAMV